jgi:hypothetical protein
MKSPQKTKEQDSAPCACCAVFFSDYAVQELEQRWDNPRGLQALIKELLEEGFGHLAKPILWRWHKLVPESRDYEDLLRRISNQIWVAGASKTIHDFDREMTGADIQRAVQHDLALLERKWSRAEATRTTKK